MKLLVILCINIIVYFNFIWYIVSNDIFILVQSLLIFILHLFPHFKAFAMQIEIKQFLQKIQLYLVDTGKAVEILEIFREKLKSQGDYEQEYEIAAVVQMLDSPLFKQITTIQDSLKELKIKSEIVPTINDNDFDFSPTGELVFQPGMSASSSQV